MDIQSLFDKEFLDGVRKDFVYEFQMAVKTVGEQIGNPATAKRSAFAQPDYIFTTSFYTKAQEVCLSETDAIEVYNTGQTVEEETIIREYNGYEIGIEYSTDYHSGKPVISSIWKRDY